MIINMKQSLIAAIGLLLSSSLFAKDYLISTSKTLLLPGRYKVSMMPDWY